MIKIYLYRIESEYIQKNMDMLIQKLCKWRYDKAAKINNIHARIESVATGLLFQKVFQEKYGIQKEDIVITNGKNGKPYLDSQLGSKMAFGRLFFNLSHSGDYVVMVSSDIDVGIDIESKDDRSFRVSNRCFCEDEYKYISETGEADRMTAFRDVWTMKESFLKYTGTGISIPLNSFTVSPDKGIVSMDGRTRAYCGLRHFTDEETGRQYSISVCTDDKKILDYVDIVNIELSK